MELIQRLTETLSQPLLKTKALERLMDEFMFLVAVDRQKAMKKIPVHAHTTMKIKKLVLMLSSTHLSPDRKTLTVRKKYYLS